MSPLTLASASAVRAQILKNAGVAFDIEISRVDEPAVKPTLPQDGEALALSLARLKAQDVASRRPGLVIGADQTLTFEGALFDKSGDLEETRKRLMAWRGKRFELHAGVALARGRDLLWTHVETSVLHVRTFSDAWLDGYLAANRDALAYSLGGFELEGHGAQLFDRVDGDYFAVLGLPLLPLLQALRSAGGLPA